MNLPRKLQSYADSALFARLSGEPLLAAMVTKTAAGAEPILATITKDMPLYTLHDRTHILNVVAWMEALLGAEGVQQMSAVECALALMAAYIHDLGMTLGSQEAETLRDDTEYRKFKDGYLDLRLQIQALGQRGESRRAEKLEELGGEMLVEEHGASGRSAQVRLAAEFSGEAVDVREIGRFEVGVFVEDIGLGHAGAKPTEHIPDGDAQPTNARFAAALASFHRDASDGLHEFLLPRVSHGRASTEPESA